jgi:hypothetical protein
MKFTQFNAKSEAAIANWRAGVVEVNADGTWTVQKRFWRKNASLAEVWLLGGYAHGRQAGDICKAYWHVHPGFRQYLCLGYIVSKKSTSFRTFYRAQSLVTEIARIKQSDALLCDVVNSRISDRLLTRWEWERHAKDSRRRLFIKRFYGEYPPRAGWLEHQSPVKA